MNDHSPAPKATRRDWIGLAVLALPCLLYSMDLTVLNLAVPHLTADLKPSASQLLWIVDIYGFFVAGFLITMGTLGDRIGRRKLLMIGAVAFGGASVLAAFAPSAELLIAARGLLGIAAATLAPSTLSLIRNMFLDAQERTLAIGIWIASFSAGGALGPLVGGVVLEHFWWGAVFLVAVPIMLLLLLAAPAYLPEFRDPNAGRMDFWSALLSLGAVLPVIYGIKRIAEFGISVWAVGGIMAGLIVGALFVRRQKQLSDPMIELRLFRIPAFSACLAINMLGLFVAFGTFLFIAQYFQLVLGMGPLEAGLWTAPSGLAFAAGSVVTPKIMRHVRPAYVLVGGFALAALGFMLLTQLDEGKFWLMSGFMIFCLGLAPVGTVTTDLVMASAPPERAGAASAISETSFEFGGAVGIAVLGSVVTAVYRNAMADLNLSGVPQTEWAAARDTLGGAAAVAQELRNGAGDALLDAAREAFTHAIQITSIIGAVATLCVALLAFLMLRHLQVGSSAHAEPPLERANAKV